MGDQYTSVSVTNYNANPPPDDGSATEANRLKWSTIKTKLTDMLNTAIASINTNVIAAFGKVDGGVISTAISYQVLAADQGQLVRGTASGITITTPDAAVVGAPFVFGFLNDSSGDITIDGSGSQTIDGDANVIVPAGTGGRLRTDGTNWFTEGQNFQSTILNLALGYLSGLEGSTAGSSATFAVAAGVANDAAGGGIMTLAAALSKTTSAWAVGTGNGALDTGTIANSTTYHAFLIKRTDTRVVDVLISLSPTAPTMPTSYTLKRRIFSMKTNGSGQWAKFTQTGDVFIWAAYAADTGTAGTSRASHTLTVPTGIVVSAMGRAFSGAGGANTIIFTSLQEEDISPASSFGEIITSGGATVSMADVERLTNTSAQIGVRASNAGISFSFNTYGWRDTRGK